MLLFTPTFDARDYKRSDDLCSVSFRLPGLDNSHYGRDGNITMQAMMRITWAAVIIPFGNDVTKTMFAYPWFSPNRDVTIFYLNYDLTAHAAMYNAKICKSDLLCQISVIHIGKSWMKVLSQMFVKDIAREPILILSCVHLFVNVHVVTRKPVPWPAWMAETVNKRQFPSSNLIPPASNRMEKKDRPTNTFIHNVYVTWSDTDENSHCNAAAYVKYVDDALHAALRFRDAKRSQGESPSTTTDHFHQLKVTALDRFVLYQGDPSVALAGIQKEIQESGVRHLQLHFYQECLEDDLLHVHIWQDGVKDNVLFASLEKDNQVVSQVIVEYFTRKSNL